MTTERLYYYDGYTLNFSAQVIERTAHNDQPAIILDHTYFYPESGGQLPDHGVLNDSHVIDVQIRASDQAVLHILDRLPDTDAVSGVIDGPRRRDLTIHHSAQHILSAALEKAARAMTVSVHMSMDSMTIDVNRALLTNSETSAVETLANQIVLGDHPVRCWFPDPSEIAGLGLRKLPDVAGKLRVVDIASGFDVTACGGTHVARTGEIGLIKFTRQEKFKGGARIEYRAGERALADYALKNDLLNTLAAELTTSFIEIPGALARLRDENKTLRAELKTYKETALSAETDALISHAAPLGACRLIRAAFPDRAIEDLRFISARVASTPGCIALLGVAGEKAQLIFGRAEDVPLDVLPALKTALSVLGSDRGGGRPNMAQGGGVPATLDTINAALDAGQTTLREANR